MYYVAWQDGTIDRVVVPARQAGNRFLGSIKGSQIQALVPFFSQTRSQSMTALLPNVVLSYTHPACKYSIVTSVDIPIATLLLLY